MLKYSLSLMPILFLVGLLQADELEKSEVNKVYVMKDKTIIFELKDDSYLKGNVLTSDCLRGKIYFENKKKNIKNFSLLPKQRSIEQN